MKQIKVRAWDLDNYQMYYSDREHDNGEGLIVWNLDRNGVSFSEVQIIDRCPGGMYHEQSHEYRRPNQDVMLWLGLKDINNKDIYDGDIVDYWDEIGTYMGRILLECNIASGCEIGVTLPNYYCSATIGWAIKDGYKFEIIGNKSENPELLKEE